MRSNCPVPLLLSLGNVNEILVDTPGCKGYGTFEKAKDVALWRSGSETTNPLVIRKPSDRQVDNPFP